MITYESDGERLSDTTACAGVRADLKMCLLESDCCRVDKKTPRECLKQGNVSSECQALRNTFFECKRSLTIGQGFGAIKDTSSWLLCRALWMTCFVIVFINLDAECT